jgi:tetratricopeptide (TPR) repeat protein
LAQARQLVGIKKWSEAKRALAGELADPQCGAEPWFLLSRIQLGEADPVAARRSAQTGLSLEPDAEWGYRLMSLAEQRLGHKRAAQRSAAQAVLLAPDEPLTLYLLTKTLMARGRTKQAGQLAERNVELNPFNTFAREAASAAALSRNQLDDAERHARAGLEIDPQNADLMVNLGLALQGQGQTAAAAEIYAAASRADPTAQRGRQALGNLGAGVPRAGAALALAVGVTVLLNANRSTLLDLDARRFLLATAILTAVLMGFRFILEEVRQRRAMAGLAAPLRSVAGRERRSVRRAWLLVTAIVTAGFALLFLTVGDLTAAGVLFALAVVGTIECLRFRRASELITVPGWRGWLPQSIRWRFR